MRVAHAQGDPTSPNLGQFAEAEASLNNAAKFVDPILAKDPQNQRALFIATTIAHNPMNLADTRGARAEELKDAADLLRWSSGSMSTHPVAIHDLYSMRYFYVDNFAEEAYYAGREFDKVILSFQGGLWTSRSRDLERTTYAERSLSGNLAAARWQCKDRDDALKTAHESIELKEAEAAGGHASLRINLANGYGLEGMILGRADAEPDLGRSREALADFQKAFDIAEDLASKDSVDYLGRHNVATFRLEMGNILRHKDPEKALTVYDHSLVRIREAKPNARTQRDEAELLVGSSYVLRWLSSENDAKQRLDRALELLRAGRTMPRRQGRTHE